MSRVFILILFICSFSAFAQQQDSVKVLQEVTIRSDEADRPLLEVPASIGLVLKEDMQRFNNTSLVSAANTLPGVRMEERSPGSYRFAIRGSSLRAPFGVRNVKVYWNELPLSDAGGNTYLNQLDANTIQKLEIIKGPGSSLYGAGTGGVILLTSPQSEVGTSLIGSFLGGSYGLRNYQIALNQPSAEVAVVPGTGGTAVRLRANDPPACSGKRSPGLTNSWPRWAPKVGVAGAKRYYWMVLSSTRREATGTRPQLYISAIVTQVSGSTETISAEYPAVYVTAQEPAGNNHIPAWDVFELGSIPK